MSRIVSLIVLVGILAVIAFLFFQVVADFLFPMFLAVLLVVIFGPVHRSFLSLTGQRHFLAAGLTTTVILVLVLAPLSLILIQGSIEGMAVYNGLKNPEFNLHSISKSVVDLGATVGLSLDAESIEASIIANAQEGLAPLAIGTTRFVGNFLIGLLVMIVSLYFFLADGPRMLDSVMRVSPLDDRYKSQLIDKFANVSRAVVLATLLSALAQGLLAGIGYYLAGVPAVFLLIVLTMLLSMVPFVGAISVWVPACLWVYFHDGRTLAAVLLAVYGTLIVSTVDNIIKPWILHGHSKLHPLLALLSVLGGIKALGPIGIFVGPMVVAFLQTLLEMLHNELEEMSGGGPIRWREIRENLRTPGGIIKP